MMKLEYFDIHSHIQFPEFDADREEVINRMKKGGVYSIVVGTDQKSSILAVSLAEKHDNLFASVGLHPNDTISESFDENVYRKLLKSSKTVAVGECGLDYYRTGKTEENKKRQKEIFEKQIKLALEFDKPLMIHCRDAYDDMLDVLAGYKKEHGDRLRGNIHFFAGDADIAEKFFNLGFTVSFTGVITFAGQYDEVVKSAPLGMIMTETDCPYVAPLPYRGKRNEPNYVAEVAKRISEIRNEDFDKVRAAMVQNAIRVFGISAKR